MNFRFTVVETSLNQAEFRWKWLRFLERSFVLGGILALLLLGFGGAILLGWITSKALAIAFFWCIASVGFVAWAIVAIAVAAGAPDRNWLAAALERVDRRLMDRLNTLLFLERNRPGTRAESFAVRIARQTQRLFAEKAAPKPFSGARPLRYAGAFVLLLASTVLFYRIFAPWDHLLAAEKAKAERVVQAENALDVPPPAINNVEQNQAWGEVRITDPGADLKVTKVDVVPLQIEAAANQALNKIEWRSTINGTEETAHSLPPPAEPRYAVYQPSVYLDELRLSDWDVMTYYAKANTEKQNSYASEVYFLEVRPFREDILKLPGGEGGKAYRCLNEMSMLINRQQHIIRQTHQHVQKPLEQERLQEQDRLKLSEAEADLGDSAQHLYAKMASELENKAIADALDNLAKAEKSLDGASKRLQNNVMNDAQAHERSALAGLVAARKSFQKAVHEKPDAFEEPKDEETSPVADSSKKLNEMAEFRNEAKAAQEFVQKLWERQRKIEQQTRTTPRTQYAALGEQEKQMAKELEDFQEQHPEILKPAETEARETQQALHKAAESLQQRSNEARNATKNAGQQLQQLNAAMKEHAAEHQLADAYRLKRMLDKQIATFGQCANPGNNVSDSKLQQTVNESRETLNQLKKIAEQEPTRDAFGPPLRESLSGPNKVDLDAKLNQAQQAQEPADKQQRAGQAGQALAKVSKAFGDSEPKALQMAGKTDSLKPGEQDSFNVGMAELQSLLRQMENNRSISAEDQAKQGRQALFDLQTGLRAQYGDNDRGNQILLQLQAALKPQETLPLDDLRKLLDELRHFSVETSDILAKKEQTPELNNIDPTRLPPAYRGRIQKYFQKLSEK